MTDQYVDTYASHLDPQTVALAHLVGVVAEECIFGLSSALGNANDALENLTKRRASSHLAMLQGARLARMAEAQDAWTVELSRAIAPVCPPSWLPMSEVLRANLTLEGGARGLRSLFTSKPSEKEVARVKRLGTLSVRVLRAVLAADGPIDANEARLAACLVSTLGLPDADAAALYQEPAPTIEQIELYGEVEPAVARGMMRGAWFAAAQDGLDPREEAVLRVLAQKLSVTIEDFEMMRNEAIARVDARRAAGFAAVEAVRYVLADRVPGTGAVLAQHVADLMVPRRYRDEALAHVQMAATVTLAGRFRGISSEEKLSALGIAWASALHDDPSYARACVLRLRHDRFAKDLGEDGRKARAVVEDAMEGALSAALQAAAAPSTAPR
jgi:tellurite resistance protein